MAGPSEIHVNPTRVDTIEGYQRHYTRHVYDVPEHTSNDPITYVTYYKNFFINEVKSYFDSHSREFPPSLKIFADMTLTLIKMNADGDIDYTPFHFGFKAKCITYMQVGELVQGWCDYLHEKLEPRISEQEGSGLIIYSVDAFSINYCVFAIHNRLGEYVPYPRGVRGGNEIFNPSGMQNSCMLQCIAAYKLQHMGKSWTRIKQKTNNIVNCKRLVNTEGIDVPVT